MPDESGPNEMTLAERAELLKAFAERCDRVKELAEGAAEASSAGGKARVEDAESKLAEGVVELQTSAVGLWPAVIISGAGMRSGDNQKVGPRPGVVTDLKGTRAWIEVADGDSRFVAPPPPEGEGASEGGPWEDLSEATGARFALTRLRIWKRSWNRAGRPTRRLILNVFEGLDGVEQAVVEALQRVGGGPPDPLLQQRAVDDLLEPFASFYKKARQKRTSHADASTRDFWLPLARRARPQLVTLLKEAKREAKKTGLYSDAAWLQSKIDGVNGLLAASVLAEVCDADLIKGLRQLGAATVANQILEKATGLSDDALRRKGNRAPR